MNPYINTDLMTNVFKSVASPATFNGGTKDESIKDIVVSEAHLGQFSRRHIHSLSKMHQGDIVEVEGVHYMIVEDVITSRGSKYKATAEVTNYFLEILLSETRVVIGNDSFGKPIYEYIRVYTDVHGIVKSNGISISGESIRVSYTTLNLLVRNTPEAKGAFKINSRVNLYGVFYKVTHLDYFKIGMIDIVLERDTTQT